MEKQGSLVAEDEGKQMQRLSISPEDVNRVLHGIDASDPEAFAAAAKELAQQVSTLATGCLWSSVVCLHSKMP